MVELILILICGLFAIPVMVVFLQVLAACLVSRQPRQENSEGRARVSVLMPAHNEEAIIADTLNDLGPQLGAGDRLLVVADNCTDDTVSKASDTGAEVLVRVDENRRGKGYALDFGIKHLLAADDRPEFLLIVDADCFVTAGALDRLVKRCQETDRPVQARYLMHRRDESPGQKIAEFAWRVKNWVRPLGYFSLGLPCQLMGTGMIFPMSVLEKMNLASGNIVEDMKLGIDMVKLGQGPEFCPEADVYSTFPADEESVRSQRVRWEHGHIGTLLAEGPFLLWLGVRKRDLSMLAMALDLMVPPLALTSLLLFTAFAVTGLAYVTGLASDVSFTIIFYACAIFSIAIALAWYKFARDILSPAELLTIPVYILRKLPIYLRFWKRRQKEWIRTGRD